MAELHTRIQYLACLINVMVFERNIFLRGTNIYLRALTHDDVEGNYRFWFNDKEITRFNSHGRFPMTPNKLLNFVSSALTTDSFLVLAVVDIKTDRHIGNISLQGINWIDRNAEIAFLLGEKEFMSKGVMFDAGTLIIKHGFEVLNLHRIHCGTSSENIGMQKLAQKLGMQREGVRREAIFKEGKYLDVVEYGLVRIEK